MYCYDSIMRLVHEWTFYSTQDLQVIIPLVCLDASTKVCKEMFCFSYLYIFFVGRERQLKISDLLHYVK